MATLLQMIGVASPTFLDNFWPNFWATVSAGTILSGLVTWLVSKAKRAKLEVSLEVASSTQGNYTLMFSVVNAGRVSFREQEIHWHVYFDERLSIKAPSKGWSQVGVKGKPYWCFKGSLGLPCFSGSSTYFFEIPVNAKGIAILDLDYYYSLSTIHGFFPRWSALEWLLRTRQFAPGGNSFIQMPLGHIKLKSI